MADEENTVEVNSPGQRLTGTRNFPVSPLTAGLAATMAAAPSGPLAPVIGLGTGLLTRFVQNRYNSAHSKYLDNLNDEMASARNIVDKIRARPGTSEDEKIQLDNASKMMVDGYMRLATDPNDSSGYQMVLQGRTLAGGILGGDIEADRQEQAKQYDAQRALIGETAKKYQGEYHAAVAQYENIEHISSEIINLVNDPEFDPNKPVNRAHLADLVSMGGMMMRDTPDAFDAVSEGAGGLEGFGIAGKAGSAALKGFATYMKSKDFKVEPSDFYKFAINMKNFAETYTKQELERIGRQTKNLEGAAKARGIVPADYSVADFVTGGEKELTTHPNPALKSREQITLPTENLGTAPQPRNPVLPPKRWGIIQRPTN